jgi:hypothetical protein
MVQQVMQAITGGGMGDLAPEVTNGVTISAWWAFGAMVVGAIAGNWRRAGRFGRLPCFFWHTP